MERRATWKMIMDMTESMKHAAINGNWEEVIQTEQQRQELIASFFEVSPSEKEASWLGADILSLIEIDKKIMALGKAGIEEIGIDIRNVRKGQIARSAYQAPI